MAIQDEDVWSYANKIWGTQQPLPEEIAKAKQLMAAVPDGLSPVEVAKYFLNLTDRNADGERYNAEWKKRSNPLIVGFFSATDYGDATDETKWCAAFMNWCLRCAGRKYSNSASSGSFRCFGDVAEVPKEGDIAVFMNEGQDQPCSGSGHVAFWMAQKDGNVTVLGGNQGNMVGVKDYPASAASSNGRPSLISVRKTPAKAHP